MVDTGDLKSPALCVWVRVPPLVPIRTYMLKNTEILRTTLKEFVYNKSNKPALSFSIETALKDMPMLPEQYYYITTVGRYDLPNDLKGIHLLVASIEEYLLSIKDQFNKSNAENIKFNLSWIVKLTKGSQVYCHRHHPDLDGVAIFHYQTPPEGTNFVLVKDGVDNKLIEDQIQENCNVFNMKTGDLLVHTSTAKHGLYKYTSDIDTIMLVFDFNYTN